MVGGNFFLLVLLYIWLQPATSFSFSSPADLRRMRAALPAHNEIGALTRPSQKSLMTLQGTNRDADPADDQPPIDKFRSLMGNLYGVAGLAHAADCYLGDSQLLVAAGSPPVQELPTAGQGLVALWCAAGPIALVASKVGGIAADVGLLFYGMVEVAGAAILEGELPNLDGVAAAAADIDPLTNAIVVQGIVLVSWLYSRNREE